MNDNWKPEIDLVLSYNTSTKKYQVTFNDIKPEGKKFVVTNSLLYELISGKIDCDCYFSDTMVHLPIYGYIENVLFRILDSDWPPDSAHWLYLCEVIAYKVIDE